MRRIKQVTKTVVISDDDFNWKINKSTVTVLLETGTIASVLNFAF